jgi:hypothetical protein
MVTEHANPPSMDISNVRACNQVHLRRNHRMLSWLMVKAYHPGCMSRVRSRRKAPCLKPPWPRSECRVDEGVHARGLKRRSQTGHTIARPSAGIGAGGASRPRSPRSRAGKGAITSADAPSIRALTTVTARKWSGASGGCTTVGGWSYAMSARFNILELAV